MNFVDPTVAFTAAVVLLPLVFVTDTASAIAYLTHPTMLAALAVTAALVLFAGPGAALAPHERRLAYWCLCNGVFYNLFLDVVAGQAQSFGLMTAQYNRVEPRYALGYLSDAGAPVFMTSALEALFQAPLGVFAFVAIRRGWPQRHAAALALSILHAAGVWYFYVPEACVYRAQRARCASNCDPTTQPYARTTTLNQQAQRLRAPRRLAKDGGGGALARAHVRTRRAAPLRRARRRDPNETPTHPSPASIFGSASGFAARSGSSCPPASRATLGRRSARASPRPTRQRASARERGRRGS
jgi:hypothetical protein